MATPEPRPGRLVPSVARPGRTVGLQGRDTTTEARSCVEHGFTRQKDGTIRRPCRPRSATEESAVPGSASPSRRTLPASDDRDAVRSAPVNGCLEPLAQGAPQRRGNAFGQGATTLHTHRRSTVRGTREPSQRTAGGTGRCRRARRRDRAPTHRSAPAAPGRSSSATEPSCRSHRSRRAQAGE